MVRQEFFKTGETQLTVREEDKFSYDLKILEKSKSVINHFVLRFLFRIHRRRDLLYNLTIKNCDKVEKFKKIQKPSWLKV